MHQAAAEGLKESGYRPGRRAGLCKDGSYDEAI